jgi:hypothetical protein
VNGYLFSGALTGWRRPKLLRALLDSAARYAYRVPTITQSTATAILTFVANAVEGDKVKVGEEEYKFTATVIAAYDVLIGAGAAESAANLLAALTEGGTPGTDYGENTVKNPAISDTPSDHELIDTVLTLKAEDFGAAYNSIAVTESTAGARMSWANPTFTGGLNQTFDSAITGAATWLEFRDSDTQVMRSPVVDDRFGRYYFASPSLPPQYNTYARITAGQSPWLLGLQPPGCAPIVAVAGGGDQAQLGFPTTTSANNATPGSNKLFLIPITPDGAMSLDAVSFTPAEDNGTAEFAAVLYEDNGGQPGLLLNIGTVITGCAVGVDVVSTFVNPTPIYNAVQYWIGFLVDSAVAMQLADDTGTAGVVADTTYTNGPPGVAPSMTTGQPDWKLWGDLTTASVIEARAYVYTWVTEYGEESAPSPPTLVNGWSNGTWTIDLYTPPLDDMGVLRNITHKRLYRTISGVAGQTQYFLVTPAGANAEDPAAGDIPVAQGQYIDTVLDDVIALNGIMASTNWMPPPENLAGIVSMPNGMAAGFKGNEVWFCEPYRPHAWPSQYVITTEFPIVGLGVIGSALVVCTSGTPYVLTGVNPGSVSSSKVLLPEPCTSRGSIVSTDQGVFYTSPNGLILVTQYGAASNTTELWITREKWRKLTPSRYTQAIHLASCYFAFGTVEEDDTSFAQKGYTIELAADTESFTIWPQPGGHRLGFQQLSAPSDLDVYNVLTDTWTGTGMLIQDGQIFYYDFEDEAPEIVPYKWKSKIFHQPHKDNFEAMKVYFDVPPGTPAQNADRNVDPVQATLAADQYGIVRVYADGNLVTTREIRTSGELLRILSGFKYEQWQWEFEGRVNISNVQVATSVKELGGV